MKDGNKLPLSLPPTLLLRRRLQPEVSKDGLKPAIDGSRRQRISRRRNLIDDVRLYYPRVFYMFNNEGWKTPAYFSEDEASDDNVLIYNIRVVQ